MRRNKECHSACEDDKRANEPSTNQGAIHESRTYYPPKT